MRRLLDEARNLRLEFLRRIYAVDAMRALLPADLDEEKQRLLTFIAPDSWPRPASYSGTGR